MDTATSRYLLAWASLGLLAGTATLLTQPLDTDHVWPVTLLGASVLVAGRLELDFDFGRTRTTFTIVEVVVTAGLLLLGPAPTLIAAVAGTALAHASRRLSPAKIVFNTAVVAVAAGIAGIVTHVVPAAGPLIGSRPVLGAALGMLAYVCVNVLAMVGLLHRLGGPHAAEGMREQLPLTALTTVAQIATGSVVAVVAIANPVLTPLVLAPVAAIHLAARGSARTTSLLTTVRAERDRLTRVIDGASDGILLLDGAGAIQVWNPAMTVLTGIPASRAIGRAVSEVLTDDTRVGDAPVRGRWLVDVAHDGPAQRELEARLQHRDGTWRAVQESHALVHDERGRCTGDVVVLRDVSRQQELERLRSDFVARVSHELRTPLTPIRGFASVLLRRGENIDPGKRREALERILERADHLATLVEDLLLVTRVDRGELDELVHPRPVDVEPIVAAAVARAGTKDPERPIAVHATPGMPKVLTDADRFGQVLDALLDNACRYSPDARPVEILVDHPGEDVRIRVVDHGPGIRHADREAIFQRFHRLEDPLTMRTSGVGLGLFLARQLTEAMQGTLHVESGGDAFGATFVCLLPTAEPVAQRSESTA